MGTQPSSRVVEGSETRIHTPVLQRFVAAAPHLFAGALLTAVLVEFVAGGTRITPRVHAFGTWLYYELIACAYAAILPIGLVVVGVVRAVRGLPPKTSRRDGSLVLLIPFAVVAWAIAPAGPERWWAVAAFLVLAMARWLPHRRQSPMLRDGIVLVGQAAGRAVRVWAYFTLAGLLTALLVLAPASLLGLEMPSVEHWQHFIIQAIGSVYFALNVLNTVFDLERRLFRSRPGVAELPASATCKVGGDQRAA